MTEQETAHVAKALARLLTTPGDEENLRALVTVFATRTQALEDALFPLITDTGLDVAVGDALDQWGALVGEPRDALIDAEYRLMIQARILVNTSDGTPERMLRILSVLAGASGLHLAEVFPKGITLSYTRDTVSSTTLRQRIARAVRRALPAATRLDWLAEAPTVTPFAFAGFPGGAGWNQGTFSDIIDSDAGA